MLVADGGDERRDLNAMGFCQVLLGNGTGGNTTLKAI